MHHRHFSGDLRRPQVTHSQHHHPCCHPHRHISINTPPSTPLTPTAAATISTTATTVSPIISTPTPRSPR
nr:hypothetical protein [Tanacetum cinerariifolium]